MAMNFTTGMVSAGLALLLGGAAHAATHRDETVYRAVEANRDDAIELLKAVVNIDSGSGDIPGGERVESILAPRLKSSGAEVRYEPAEAAGLPANLVAVFHRTGKA